MKVPNWMIGLFATAGVTAAAVALDDKAQSETPAATAPEPSAKGGEGGAPVISEEVQISGQDLEVTIDKLEAEIKTGYAPAEEPPAPKKLKGKGSFTSRTGDGPNKSSGGTNGKTR